MAKRRSFGSAFLGFLRGIISLVLFLVLVISVGANVIFKNDNSALRIDFMNYHTTFFVNNTSDLKNIDEGSLCLIDHTIQPEENTYVLCSVGNEGKRVLCLESITKNENGTLAYNVRADRMSSLDTVYSLPASKIFGTVYNKDDLIGDIIVFVRQPQGVAASMLIPAFFLILLSVGTIRGKKARYDDDLLEAEMAMEDLRKKRRNDEKKAEEQRRLMAQKAAEEAENALAAKVEAAVREAESAVPEQASAPAVNNASAEEVPAQPAFEAPVSDPEPAPFKFEEYKRKSDVQTPAPAPAPVQQSAPVPAPVPAAPVTPAAPSVPEETASKYEYTDFAAEAEKESAPAPAEEKPVFQEVPLSVHPSYKYENLVQSFTKPSEIKYTEEAAEKPAPVQQSAPAPVKKKAKPPVKKLDAESIDDLIRILEEEKKKLD